MKCSQHFLPTPFQRHSERRGAVSAMVLLVLLLLGALSAAQVQRVMRERRQMAAEFNFLQAEKLADAGIVVALSRKKNDPVWSGETFQFPNGTIHQTKSGSVLIKVTAAGTVNVTSSFSSESSDIQIPFQVVRTRKSSHEH